MWTPDEARERRTRMVESQIAARGIRNPRLLEAFMAVPREDFVPASLVNAAYDDRALGVGMRQTISQPYIVAWMTEALRIEQNDVILEVGTGTGYQTAILAQLAREVFTIERIETLSIAAQTRLNALDVRNVTFRIGDGSAGWPKQAPFDGIIVTAGAPAISRSLVNQLAPGGRAVTPVGPQDHQRLTTVERYPDRIVETPGIAVRFVRLIGAEGFTE
ncbi:MAG: protein-L-isoaspartate(D-aspartate) O-methyltransferase [Phycisphaerae bacterium]